jgi:hypothetical protein
VSICSSDESGKTLAIIIGLVAAVAIVIVFLSFLRRAGGVGGKIYIYTSLKLPIFFLTETGGVCTSKL